MGAAVTDAVDGDDDDGLFRLWLLVDVPLLLFIVILLLESAMEYCKITVAA
jgi:hypothetical protein